MKCLMFEYDLALVDKSEILGILIMTIAMHCIL